MAKFLFRRIRGRIVPIKLGSSKLPADATGGPRRVFYAKDPKQSHGFATATVSFPKGRTYAKIDRIGVAKEYRGHGISRALFKRIQEFSARAGKKFVRSSNIEHPAQVKIRGKMRSRFVVMDFEGSKLAGTKGALKAVQDSLNPRYNRIKVVRGTTRTKKRGK